MKKVLIVVFLIIVVIAVVIFLILNYSPKPLSENEKQAAIAKILGRKPNLTDNTPTGDKTYKGRYITFIYPAAAKQYTQTLNGSPIAKTDLENFIFDISDPRIIFSMEVTAVPNTVTGVNDFPSVKLRQIEANLYTQGEIIANNLSGVSFDKVSQTGVEKSAFFYKDGKVYSFSIQGNDKKAVGELFTKVIASTKFL